jgi:hypothetical protein
VVGDLLRRRTVQVATVKPRSLGVVAIAEAITRAEGAVLAAALLRSSGMDARVLWATIDDEASVLCVWREGTGPWRPVPIWPALRVKVHGERVVDGPVEEEVAPLVGWDVIDAYYRITPRLLADLSTIAAGTETAAEAEGGAIRSPACPSCQAEMRSRRGPKGPFWGCSQYPTCRATLEMSRNVPVDAH